MEEGSSKTYVFGQDGATVPAWLAYGNNGFGNGFGGGLGGGILGFLLGLFFGNGWGGFGGFGGNGMGNGAGFLANQMNNDSGRELLMNAITSQGEASRTAVQSLATSLGQDFNLVNAGVQTIQSALQTLAVQQAVSVPQLINSIQSGNSTLMSKLCDCCCENRLLTTQQGYEAQIRTLEQTNQLGSQADRNFNSLSNEIAGLKASMIDQFCQIERRELQNKIDTQGDTITQLRGQLDNDRQTAQLYAAISPIQAKVNEIANKQPNTVPVEWPNITAVNNTPNVGGFGFGSGFGWGGFPWLGFGSGSIWG